MKGEMMRTVLKIFFLCLPYAFIALYLDASYRSMLGYGVLLLSLAFALFELKNANFLMVFLSQLFSYLLSFLLCQYLWTDNWQIYFKPFEASSLSLLIMSICLTIELILGYVYRQEKKKEGS